MRVLRGGQAVANALVVLRGPGIRASKVTGAAGLANLPCASRTAGVLTLYVPNVCLRRAGVAGVVRRRSLAGRLGGSLAPALPRRGSAGAGGGPGLLP